MRYVFILIMSMSFPAHAEWEEYGYNIYFKDVELNTDNQRVSVQILIDDFYNYNVPGDSSMVHHRQYQCENGVPTKQRTFWSGYYEGRMGTGNVTYTSEGAPWLPFSEFEPAKKLCHDLYELRSKRSSPERNPLY
jgi:hypothetical protein